MHVSGQYQQTCREQFAYKASSSRLGESFGAPAAVVVHAGPAIFSDEAVPDLTEHIPGHIKEPPRFTDAEWESQEASSANEGQDVETAS